ncbi:serine hydrolase [Streptomyces spinoverrucosus]|uniref:Serine hydrolase n=1 Tax=Streptomyces spinoverrucosus TaxID=284043 RepID=A0A4Y3VL86_9ACTN|nr:serine hydrolase [Streptomyces spinoverrucosus]GEC07617.1 serine hydrolase [Streptomyces spinoverrucosus]GHB61904.1 serine hydrolase [Streptomyces spinoverrucosus]
MTDALGRVRAAFAEAGVTGWLHAVDIDTGAQLDAGADQPVCTASVHKLCLLVTLHELADTGDLDLTEQVDCPPLGRTPGPTGLAAMRDPVRMSLRDLAYLMTAVSDNTAADLLLGRVGLDAVNRTTARLGLTRTHAVHTFGELLATLRQDAGPGGARILTDPHVLTRLRALDPARTNRSTPRDMTRLLSAVWRDEACAPEHAAAVRRLLGLQVWPHRLASGFPFDDVHVAGKTGTLPTLRNEVGVVEYPDGGRYAVAVFTRTANPAATLPAADSVIGTTARLAVEALRART